jgi:hypothetical protein
MAVEKPSDADCFWPLTPILWMPGPPARSAPLNDGSGFVDHTVEEIADLSGHHQNAASEVIRQKASGL